nr:MAG TPA: hypothetical protein [Caudoviricetes sp.]
MIDTGSPKLLHFCVESGNDYPTCLQFSDFHKRIIP